MFDSPNDVRHANAGDVRRDDNLRDVMRFALGFAVVAAVVLGAAVVWVSTCHGATADVVACGTPQRMTLALAAPAVLMAGGSTAFFRWYQGWRRGERPWAWHGAGWFLVALTLLLITTMPTVTGVAVPG